MHSVPALVDRCRQGVLEGRARRFEFRRVPLRQCARHEPPQDVPGDDATDAAAPFAQRREAAKSYCIRYCGRDVGLGQQSGRSVQ